jgi:hypothetical protein
MAVSIPSVGSTSETASNVATPTTLTPGLPGTRAVGDILLCATVCRSGTPTVSCSTSGWVELANVSGTNGRLALYACLVTGSELAAQPVWASLTTGTSGTGASAQIAAVRGLDFSQAPLTGLLHQLSAAQNQAASTTIQAMGATITPTKANSAIFSIAVRQDNDVTDGNWPVIATANNITWAKVAAVLNSGSGADHAQSFQWGQQGAATAIAAKTVTVTAGSSDASSAILVSLLTATAKTLGAATSAGVAQALSLTQAAQSKTVTAATETGAAQPLDYEIVASDQQKTITAATETDAAQALSLTQAAQSKTIGQAVETDAAQVLAFSQAAQSASITSATETDASQAVSSSQTAQSKSLASVAETDAAQALALTQSPLEPTLTPAEEANAAQALSITQAAQERTLGPAAESDNATAISHGADIHASLTPPSETDTAPPLAFTQGPAQTVSIGSASSSSVAVALNYSKAPLTRTLTAASEIDTATALNTAGGSFTILPATSTNMALALDYTGGSGPVAVTGDIRLGPRGQLVGPTTGRIVV